MTSDERANGAAHTRVTIPRWAIDREGGTPDGGGEKSVVGSGAPTFPPRFPPFLLGVKNLWGRIFPRAETVVRIDGARVMQSVAENIRATLFRMSLPVTSDEREKLRWADDGGAVR